jgi:hypothetical protein
VQQAIAQQWGPPHREVRLQEAQNRAGSADLIFTDPPYSKEFLPLWSDLSKFARSRAEAWPLLITYAGQWALPELLARLGEHLRYVWIGSVHHRAHQHYQYMPRKSGSIRSHSCFTPTAHNKPIALVR